MLCEDLRVALSARLDGEDPGLAEPLIDAHLVACSGCRTWLTGAEHLTRLVRVQAAEPVADRTEAIMAAVAADAATVSKAGAVPDAHRSRPQDDLGRQRVLRLAVAGFAFAQLLVAVSAHLALIGIGAQLHTHHELGALDAALAVGFLLAAYRPALARAYTPLACALALLLAAVSVLDVARGATTFGQETGHLAAVAQAVLLWALARTQPEPARPRVAG
jgi:predicted anti-sigma-YlaC factor YlaD